MLHLKSEVFQLKYLTSCLKYLILSRFFPLFSVKKKRQVGDSLSTDSRRRSFDCSQQGPSQGEESFEGEFELHVMPLNIHCARISKSKLITSWLSLVLPFLNDVLESHPKCTRREKTCESQNLFGTTCRFTNQPVLCS